MHQCTKFILFWSSTLHVSDVLSVHHQESKTVYTASGICQTDTADCFKQILLTACKQSAVSVWQLYVQSWTADDGRKDRPKHV